MGWLEGFIIFYMGAWWGVYGIWVYATLAL